jgi:transcriptional regulator with XRE-family HTH domain
MCHKDFPLFAQRLLSARQNKGATQEEAAKNIGVNRNTWTQWESGSRIPRNAKYLKSICRYLDVSVDWILGIDLDK